MARKPDLKFSYQPKYNLWKIHAFPTSEYLILELRDQATLQAIFDIITTKGEVICEGLSFEEDWWISVAQLNGSEAIFYTFDNANNPEIKSYISFDLVKLEIAWQKESVDLTKYINEKIHPKNITVTNPFHYSQGSNYYNTVESFLKGFLNVHITHAVDYLEHESNVLISYFVAGKDKLVNKLLVINNEKEVLLHEDLGVFNNGISDNTFFIIDNTLIFAKGFREFFMYDIQS